MRRSKRDSDTADAIAARVQAFRKLKYIVDEKVLREIEGCGSNPVHGLFVQVRRVLSFLTRSPVLRRCLMVSFV